MRHLKIFALFSLLSLVANLGNASERLIVVNEGLWQSDNGRITYFVDGEIVSNQWFRDVNGYKLGDTPNDIILVNNDLLAIAVNWSNIVQFIDSRGRAIAATEDVPNNRKLCTDGRYVYVSSYGHECMVNGQIREFTKGFVAKIDVNTFKVVDAVEVGYEPEGIAIYNDHLFVANTGGYAFQENHEYETTVSVINAETMKVVRNVDTGQINLYGKMSQSGQYLCINSPGDYYDINASAIIFDCAAVLDGKPDAECLWVLDYASTYNCVDSDGNFYAIGSRFSYYTGDYEFNYLRLNPQEILRSDGGEGVYEDFPGSVLDDLKSITMPYGIYVNPYSGYIYATDAGSFAAAGALYQWTPDGNFLGKYKTYINPAHFVALPDSDESGIENISVEISKNSRNSKIYDMTGREIKSPLSGQIYIHKGKKFIYK